MKLKECQTLWGISIVHLKEHSKRYRIFSIILYTLDILIIAGLTAFMYYNNVNYSTYGFVLVSICLLFHFIFYTKLNPEKWEAFKFYKKHISYNVIKKKYNVDENKLYSVLYCTGYKRLRQNRSFNEYKELMLSACCENIKYSRSIMKYIKKYEDESGNLTCYIIEKGKKQYFIDFEDEVENTESEDLDDDGGIEDGIDNEGAVEELKCRSED